MNQFKEISAAVFTSAAILVMVSLQNISAQSSYQLSLENHNLSIASDYVASTNWLKTYRNCLGISAPGDFVAGQIGEGAILVTSRNSKGMILLKEQSAVSRAELIAEMEAGYYEGNGTNMFLAGEIEEPEAGNFVATYRGTISGIKAEMQTQTTLLSNGVAISVMTICKQDHLANNNLLLEFTESMTMMNESNNGNGKITAVKN